MIKRAATAVVLIPLVVWVALYSPVFVWKAVTAIVAALTFVEFCAIARAHGISFPCWLGVAGGLAILVAPSRTFVALPSVVAAVLMALALRGPDLARVLTNSATVFLGLFYIFGGWASSFRLGAMNRYWLLYAMALNWVGDIAAYLVGRAIGRHKLAPVVSPNKSWEGAIASVVASAAFGYFYTRTFLPAVGPFEAIAMTAVANVVGQLGDLCESALKRGAGIKDSGTLLPGHGGWLDRTDSTLFAMPVVLLWLSLRA